LLPYRSHSADLYVWSKHDGLRRLKRGLAPNSLGWLAGGDQLAVAGGSDCIEESMMGTETVTCMRAFLLDASSGAVRYRTPANISPDGLKVVSGRLYCFSHEPGSTEDRIRVGLEGMNSPESWWLFDPQQNQVARSDPPVFTSPDGRYVVSPNQTLLHVTTPDGKTAFDVRLQFVMYTPDWLGAHSLKLDGLVLDLETAQLRKVCAEDGVSLLAARPDATIAVLAAYAGSVAHYYWGKAL
jgi:hypothetical protein